MFKRQSNTKINFSGIFYESSGYIFSGSLLHQWPLLLSWFNFNPSMDKYIHYKLWDYITYPFLNFNGATVEV